MYSFYASNSGSFLASRAIILNLEISAQSLSARAFNPIFGSSSISCGILKVSHSLDVEVSEPAEHQNYVLSRIFKHL